MGVEKQRHFLFVNIELFLLFPQKNPNLQNYLQKYILMSLLVLKLMNMNP